MRDKILEYLEDRCCELANIKADIVYYSERINKCAKDIIENDDFNNAGKISDYYAEHQRCVDRYATLHRAVSQLAHRIGLGAEFEIMLKEYLIKIVDKILTNR